jgi:hypothetical protein
LLVVGTVVTIVEVDIDSVVISDTLEGIVVISVVSDEKGVEDYKHKDKNTSVPSKLLEL